MLTKAQLPDQIVTQRTIVRRATLEDLPQIGAWPDYPGIMAVMSMGWQPPLSPKGPLWWTKIDAPERCHYSVVLPQTGEVVGVHVFTRIDWANAVIGNMGIRIRPDLCGQGYGRETLAPLLTTVLNSGIKRIRFDVAATNERAVRCYTKCGMRVVGEFWLPDESDTIDPSAPEWTPLMKNIRREGDKWMIRFHWMEIQAAPPEE